MDDSAKILLIKKIIEEAYNALDMGKAEVVSAVLVAINVVADFDEDEPVTKGGNLKIAQFYNEELIEKFTGTKEGEK